MQVDKSTGTFVFNSVAYCRGFYGTVTEERSSCDLTPPSNKYWAVTAALNGTGLRVFSVSKLDAREMGLSDFEPWKQDGERLWFLATFKNIEGHKGRWNDGVRKITFGEMFDEILGEGVENVLEMTRDGKLCISYFMRHKDNDIHNEMGEEESHVIQTLVWNIETQKFVGPSMPEWPTPMFPVRNPTVLYKNDHPDDNEMFDGEYVKNGSSVEIKDGQPLLLTVYFGGELVSIKLITHTDELLRLVRSRSHNRFVALLVCKLLFEQYKTSNYLEEMEVAKARLFTQEEFDGFEVNLKCGRDELIKELDRKYDGGYVAFPNHMFRDCRFRQILEHYTNLNSQHPEDYETNRELYKTAIWKNLCKCAGNWRKVKSLEQFWDFYVRPLVK